ncbi:Aliphatic amidase expression-regulating protein [bacterium HR40]|nr:Aliphatic amidase expression-regulating protein [bacterium HR40]
MTTRRDVLALASALILLPPAVAAAAETIRIGELMSYNRFAAFAEPYRNGWQLGIGEINAAGGVAGKMLEVVSRDDGGTTGDAVRVAEELVSGEKVSFLFGTFLSNVGLAVADFANQKRILFIAAEPLTDALSLDKGNRYTFRMRPSTWMQTAMLVDEVRDLGVKRWAVVAPNYEYGQAAAAAFRQLLTQRMPGAEIVAEQFPALGKIDAGATIAALEQANPDGIFNALFAGDLAKFVREGSIRGTFEGRTVVSLLTGEPEYLDPLGAEAPVGWIVTGYPWDKIDDPKHRAFVEAYQQKYKDHPRLGSLLGYIIARTIGAMLQETEGSTDTETMIAALERITVDTPVGPIRFRALDNQSTLGAWVGKLAVENGRGTMVDVRYRDGADYLLPEAEVRKVRTD